MATLQELLHPQVIFQSVTSRLKRGGDAFQSFMKMELGGGNQEQIRGRNASYDIFDNVRTVASGRAPNTGPATTVAQAVAQQPVTLLRVHEKISMYYDSIFPLRVMGRPSTTVDDGGKEYISRQEGILKQRFINMREFLVAGMLRDSIQFVVDGDIWSPVFSGGTFTVSQQVPAANKTTLGGIITTLWSDTTNADIFDNIMAMNAKAWVDTGFPLKHFWCNSKVWNYIASNAGLRNKAGSANTFYSEWERGADDKDISRDIFTARLKALPHYIFHIYDGVLKIGTTPTDTKLLPDTLIIATPEQSSEWATMISGSEMVVENEMSPATERAGLYFWPQYVREPARVEVVGVDNVMPVLRIPKAIQIGTIA